MSDSLFDASLFDVTAYDTVPAPQVDPEPALADEGDGSAADGSGADGSGAEPATDANEPDGGPESTDRRHQIDNADNADIVPIDPDDGVDALAAPVPDVPDIASAAFADLLGLPDPPGASAGISEIDEALLREPSADVLWGEIVGQAAAVGQLRASTLAPVHAYLFAGPPGVGKLDAARAFAAALLCPRGGCGHCSVCVRAMAQAHPDLVVVEREGASISVDQAREILRLAMRSPLEGDRKVLVLVDFHLVTIAAPTLLKIIEEPPPSTVFVVLAEQITPELVTIASRCVVVTFASLGRSVIEAQLVSEGATEEQALRAADMAGGRLDRARLLVVDPSLASRMAFWEQVPARLDGTGAAVSVVAAETVTLLDQIAVGPLAERQQAEADALEARLEASGIRGGAGARKDLLDRHKREQKRVRDDELRYGLAALSRRYASAAAEGGPTAGAAMQAVDLLSATNVHLERNPSLLLLLQSLFLRLPALR